MTRACRHVWVSGRVQGVAYRWSAANEARRLSLHGWVRNLVDGRVEGWIEGSADAVDAMLVWLARGPSPAHVDDLEVHVETAQDHDSFEIRTTPRD